MAERSKENGVQLISPEPIEVCKERGVFSLDPEGSHVEFFEYPDIASLRPGLVK